jgi:hypothetical protein
MSLSRVERWKAGISRNCWLEPFPKSEIWIACLTCQPDHCRKRRVAMQRTRIVRSARPLCSEDIADYHFRGSPSFAWWRTR